MNSIFLINNYLYSEISISFVYTPRTQLQKIFLPSQFTKRTPKIPETQTLEFDSPGSRTSISCNQSTYTSVRRGVELVRFANEFANRQALSVSIRREDPNAGASPLIEHVESPHS